jgi:hypothetical protein
VMWSCAIRPPYKTVRDRVRHGQASSTYADGWETPGTVSRDAALAHKKCPNPTVAFTQYTGVRGIKPSPKEAQNEP